jgi:hypothetical protein
MAGRSRSKLEEVKQQLSKIDPSVMEVRGVGGAGGEGRAFDCLGGCC